MNPGALPASAASRAARQRRERFVRKRSESAAREIWSALIINPAEPNWKQFVAFLPGLRLPTCGCVQCAADAIIQAAELEVLRHAKK